MSGSNVEARYLAAGWTVIKMPRNCIVDFITSSPTGGRVHFVQVVTDETSSSARYSLEAQNAFIQNAMSNCAVPVYARIKPSSAEGGLIRILFEDVNSRASIRIGTDRAGDSAPVKVPPVKTLLVKPAPVKPAPVKPAPVKPAPVKTTAKSTSNTTTSARPLFRAKVHTTTSK